MCVDYGVGIGVNRDFGFCSVLGSLGFVEFWVVDMFGVLVSVVLF